MTRPEFVVTWDYRCPFARNFCEHVLEGLAGGAAWDVTFRPFSLEQAHVGEDEADVWDDPAKADAVVAMQAGIAARDRFPDKFAAAHAALFAARHDHGLDLRDHDVVRAALETAGLDAGAVFAEIAAGAPLKTFKEEHEQLVAAHAVFGVPTVIVGDEAVFVRVMTRPRGDAEAAAATVERVLDLVTACPDINELKHTRIPR